MIDGLIQDFIGGWDFGAYTNVVIAVIILLASLIAAKITYWIIEKWLIRLTARTKTELDDKILRTLRKPVYYILILIGVQVASGYLFIETFETFAGYISTFISIVTIIIVAWIISRVVDIVIDDFGKKLTEKTESTLDDEALPFVIKIVNIGIYLIAFMIILGELEYDVMPLVAGLGIAGFAIGFAMKDSISNILAGFFILLDRPFVRGERIEVGGYKGDIVDIGLRTTKIKPPDNVILTIPNSKIISEVVTNYALPEPEVRLETGVGVAYGTDVEKVKKILLNVAKGSKNVLKKPGPEVSFVEFGDSSLNFKLRCWIPDFRRFAVLDELNTEINRRFEEEGIDIPFPIRTVYLKKE
ncbi:MAG: hypothetical protein A7316_11080 [Candidatus Altiarchaeales archaeon WOR_SM1_86-2]|nr:MAG: hypothetical protein A7316_11080 [Candidatus Altiarchaeales archaeon WOR_SM1_86-2]